MVEYSEIISEIIASKKTESASELVESSFQDMEYGVKLESYNIKTDTQADYYGKEKGRYDLITIPNVLLLIEKQIEYIAMEVYKVLKKMVGKLRSKDRLLVIGLGNRHITSDSLGVKVVSQIKLSFVSKNSPKIMALCPSVYGLTGIETYDIISGVVSNTKPTHIILIDSLCASNLSRLGQSIQITNTGLCPGSGVGNKRRCIDKSLCKNVYSIGVPLLIYAKTFIENTFDKFDVNLSLLNSIMQKIKKDTENKEIWDLLNNIKKIYSDNIDNTIVSIKDIKECVDILGFIIASAINKFTGIE